LCAELSRATESKQKISAVRNWLKKWRSPIANAWEEMCRSLSFAKTKWAKKIEVNFSKRWRKLVLERRRRLLEHPEPSAASNANNPKEQKELKTKQKAENRKAENISLAVINIERLDPVDFR
jgi:hypothetical protein